MHDVFIDIDEDLALVTVRPSICQLPITIRLHPFSVLLKVALPVMANRVRRRNRGLSSSGDVMAKEPDFGFSDAGPHVPMVYRPSDSGDEADSISYKYVGVPLGLIGAIPLLLQGRNVSYGQQAVFSFAYWPFSMKLLWAPVVDSVYWKRIGRRKSWMVPCQYLIGLFMLVLSFRVSYIMGEGTG
ncbi:hypothetical protein NECAME_16484 [Necator americanus]|uniref:Uncharacterized protein n=1 Tax=Necator americanus TaxID=51031 RepID=W2TW50_NECAM|nr:hypothetical protein NECAME_16484 [Necator americanus]ETN86083.1 hypothetical protein NECAME_16484 [Necator americanus]